MPRTSTRVRTTVNAANLERLGAARLAELLAQQARHDRSLRDILALVLAEAAGGADLVDYIDRRVLALAKGRPVDRDGEAKLYRELDGLRQAAVTAVAARDIGAAAALLRQMIDTGPSITRRASDPTDALIDWQEAVLGDLVRIWAEHPPSDAQDVVVLAVACSIRAEAPLPAAVRILAPVLGGPGLQAVRRMLKAELEEMPAEPRGGRWGSAGQHAYIAGNRMWQLRQRLGEIADLLGDVDDYIALQAAQPRAQVNVRAIVERLLKAGRGEEALAWLDDGRYQNRQIPTLDLRLAALEALDRTDEAQALRWQRFERQLDRDMLKEYLRRLPDFEDFEAERRAMAVVLANRSATDALTFLLDWPDLDTAARLIRERHDGFGPTPPSLLLRAGDALLAPHPAEAAAAIRLGVENTLERGQSPLFDRAALALADSAALEVPARPEAEPETYAAFVDRLRQAHARQWAFWRAFDAATR